MCTEVNSVMGLQATAATKRKHEITFDGKEANTYTNCSPPIKVSKWSKNSSLVEALEEKMLYGKSVINNNNNSHHNNNNNTNKTKNCGDLNSHRKPPGAAATTTTATNSIINGIEVTKPTFVSSMPSTVAASSVAVAATTPLPPTASSPVPEDSIAKLEEVAAAHCETWHGTHAEPVDCISKLQAVAVPSDPWGSIATRSTLATTLLSTDEIDDDDDDFEDDYEEEESIIPTYCPLRYHPFAATPASALQQQRSVSYAPSATTTHGGAYGVTRPNYYSEPFPQQNCSRTGGPQHLRMSNGAGAAFPQWPSGNGAQQFYVPSEAEYPPPQQQQTIRCAENGKSYLDLGCSTPPPPMPSINSVTSDAQTATPPPPPYSSMQQHIAASALEARHALKRCCEGRSTWCNTNKHCYKDIRMKIRNLSMFKLSRFRQVSEQSLYRSVLICNTLKYIDREIETETKEIHQAAHAAHQHHQHTQYQHLHHPHHLQHHHHHHHHHNLLQHNHQQQQPQPQPHLQQQQQHQVVQQQQQQQQQLHQEYSPVISCARVASLDYQSLQPQQQQQHFQQQQQQHQPHLYNNHNAERLATTPLPFLSTQLQEQQKASAATPTAFSSSSNNCDPSVSASAALHPYDHYPFRESQSGRATPFPNQPVISTPPASTPTQQLPQHQLHQHQQQQHQTQPLTSSSAPTIAASTTAAAVSSALVTAADADSSYADDDCTRSINWSSVLSLSSQSALDPLNNNELFSIIPAAPSPPTATSVNSNASAGNTATTQVDSAAPTSATAVAISGSFTTVHAAISTSNNNTQLSTGNAASNRLCNSQNSSPSAAATTTATFTTLSTISSATYSMTSSYASSLSQQAAANSSAASSWEYGFLDMDFGLGSEFTELMPSCKLSSDELFKSGLTPVAASRYSSVHDNELEQPAHIMVGS